MSDLLTPPPPPPEPPPYLPPAAPAATPHSAQPPAYWAPQPAMALAPKRSRSTLVLILSIVAAGLVLVLAGGGYLLVGSSTASARVSSADDAIAQTRRIDFTTTLFQISGGFDIGSSSFDPSGFQSSVNRFVEDAKADGPAIADDRSRLESAQRALSDMGWLTAFDRGSLDAASQRIDRDLKALDTATTITNDLTLDGQFYQAYAAAITDLGDYIVAANAGNRTGAVSKLELLKSDVGNAVPLATAPGLPSSVRDYVIAFQAFVTDLIAVINASLGGDQAAYNVAVAQATKDSSTLSDIDMSGMDTAFQSFYQPLISSYDAELRLAAG